MINFFKNLIKFTVYTCGLIFLMLCFLFNNKIKNKSENQDNDDYSYVGIKNKSSVSLVNPPNKPYILNIKEVSILNTIFDNEIESFINGNPTIIGHKISITTAQKASYDYKQNQVAADQKYYNKTILLLGTIESINSGLGNKPYISLQSNDFISPQIKFYHDDIERISKLKRGQNLSLVCKGEGSVIGTPVFDNCQFSDDFAHKKIEIMKNNIHDFLERNKSSNRTIAYLSIFPITVAKNINDESACLSNNKKCLSTIKKQLNKKFFTKMKKTALEIGVILPDKRTKI